ncbi:DNA polymerase III subunit delta' [Helicobacter sp. L8]|uniref:DNA polymerase III subunit delta' n=1 Tax=Helicobacter sp. L8 TaxID=2316078 RepID=UPI000EB55883|nr:DNA polymerase III subunit delta' [Helicobacter sp. L8]
MSNTLILANAPKQEALDYKMQLEAQAQSPLLVQMCLEEELKIEHAQEIKRACVLSYPGQKIYIVAAHHFNVFAQNALLKILEEPPAHTRFVLIAKHKHALLPTILSRLSCEDRRAKASHARFGLDLCACTLGDIYTYLQDLDRKNLSPEESKLHIEAFLFALHESAIPLDLDLLHSVDQAMHANYLYYRPSYNLLPLLLKVLELRDSRQF